MTQRLIDAEKIVRHIIESAPWDGEEAHRQLLKEARAYFVKHPTGLCLLRPEQELVTIEAPPIPLLLQREWMAQALFEVDAPEHREWEDVWLDERERYLCLADAAIRKAAALGSPS